MLSKTYFLRGRLTVLAVILLILFASSLDFLQWGIARAESLDWVKDVALTYRGGYGPAYRGDVAFDSFGNSYITGCGNESGIFVASYDPSGNARWFKQPAGGSNQTNGVYSIVTDSQGKVYVIGTFCGTVVFGSGEARETAISSINCKEIFVASYENNGDFLWVRQIGNSSRYGYITENTGTGIGVDDNDYIYVTGDFVATAVFREHLGSLGIRGV